MLSIGAEFLLLSTKKGQINTDSKTNDLNGEKPKWFSCDKLIKLAL